MNRLLAKNLRVVGTWVGTPLGFVALCLLADWFLSTPHGALVGLVGGSLGVITLALLTCGLFYVFRK